MDSYEVRIYPTAKQDLIDVVAYLNTLSPETALKYYDELTGKIAGLSELPLRCPPARKWRSNGAAFPRRRRR